MYENTLNNDTFVCFSCKQSNEIGAKFCEFCNPSLNQNSVDEIIEIDDNLNIWVKVTEDKPKFIVFFVAWFLHLPVLLLSLYLVLHSINEMSGSLGFFVFWMGLFITAFCAKILYKVTKNYFIYGKKQDEGLVRKETTA